MDKFHRYNPTTQFKGAKHRQPTNKKRLRDLQRLLTKGGESLPQEMRDAKRKDVKELKKMEKKKQEAEKFELRYKKIKFFGKYNIYEIQYHILYWWYTIDNTNVF